VPGPPPITRAKYKEQLVRFIHERFTPAMVPIMAPLVPVGPDEGNKLQRASSATGAHKRLAQTFAEVCLSLCGIASQGLTGWLV